MRLFIAIDLSKEAKQEIEALKQEFNTIKGLRFVDKKNIHITLKFLGEVDDKKVKKIINFLDNIKLTPFKLALNKIGCFPDERRIKVLWVGTEPIEPLRRLKQQITKKLPDFKEDYGFKSHITFARVKFLLPEDEKKIIEILANKQVKKKEFDVKKFVLYKSILTPKGPEYEVVKEFS